MLEDGNFTMSQFPVVAVQSCAMNPEDVDVGATWMTQRMENETAVSGAVRGRLGRREGSCSFSRALLSLLAPSFLRCHLRNRFSYDRGKRFCSCQPHLFVMCMPD